MEYQLYSDPLWGKRVKLSDEHRLVARWFNDELYDNDELLQRFQQALNQESSRSSANGAQELVINGKEMRVMMAHGEVLFESHGLHHVEDDLDAYAADELVLDESELVAACGIEDLLALMQAWQTFR
ncbi:YacL family protein [Pseudoalteromonas sp. T1lg75]|uniref:YacL family protein n=1 Tax=Pseudoalteromonas sp. T1lg75 TaxID=2077102 RepID=UPI000CF6D779|nr:YacL family protein [Pseudoalteromonas sp. T1lg75]